MYVACSLSIVSFIEAAEQAEQAEVQMVWGIPRWVFFGWLIPLVEAEVAQSVFFPVLLCGSFLENRLHALLRQP